MATNVGALYATLEVRDLYTAALNKAATQFSAFGNSTANSLNRMTSSLKSFGTSAQQAGRSLMPLSVGLIGIAKYSTDVASTFEAAMIRLTTIAGVTTDEIDQVRAHILKLAPEVGVGPLALADAMYTVSSTMTNTTVALQVLDIAAKSVTVGLGDAKDMAKALTAVLLSYGTENMSAAKAADILTQTIKEGGAEAKELAPRLVDVVPMAAMLGVSFEEVGANIATFTKLGAPAADAVVTLSGVLTAMMKPTHRQTAALKELGLSLGDLRVRLREQGLAATLRELTNRFAAMGTRGEEGLARIFGRVQALRNVLAVSKDESQAMYQGVLSRVQAGVGSFERAFTEMQKSQVYTWGVFKAQVESIALAFGESLLPAFKAVLNSSKDLLTNIQRLADSFADLNPETQKFYVYVGLIIGLLGPVTYVLGSIAKAIRWLIVPLKLIPPLIEAVSMIMAFGWEAVVMYAAPFITLGKVVLAFLSGPWGLLASALLLVGSIVYTVIKNWDDLSAAFSKAGSVIIDWAVKSLEYMASLPSRIIGIFTDVINGIKTQFSKLRFSDEFLQDIRNIKTVIIDTFNSVVNFVVSSWNSIVTLSSNVWSSIVNIVKISIDTVSSVISTFASWIKDAFSALWNIGVTLSSIVWTEFVAVIQTGATAIVSALTTLGSWVAEFFRPIWELSRDLVVIVFTEMYNVIQTITSGIMSLLQPVVDFVVSIFNPAWQLAKELVVITWTEMGNVITTVGNLIWSGISYLVDKVSGIFSAIAAKVKAVISIWEAFRDTINDIIDDVKGLFVGFGDSIKDFLDSVSEWLKDHTPDWKFYQDKVSEAIDYIGEKIKAAKPEISSFLSDIKQELNDIFALIYRIPKNPKGGANLPQLDLTRFTVTPEVEQYFKEINAKIQEQTAILNDQSIPNFRKALEGITQVKVPNAEGALATFIEYVTDLSVNVSKVPSMSGTVVAVLSSRLKELTDHTQDANVATKTTVKQFEDMAQAVRDVVSIIPGLQLTPELNGLLQAFKEPPKGIEALKKTMEEQQKEAEAYAKELKKIRDEVTGLGADEELGKLVKVFNSLTDAQKANPKVVDAVLEAYDKLRPKVNALSTQFEELREKFTKPIKLTIIEERKVLGAISQYQDSTQASGYGNMPTAKTIADELNLNQYAVANFIEGLKKKNEAAAKANQEYVKEVEKSNERIAVLMSEAAEMDIKKTGDVYSAKIKKAETWAIQEANKIDVSKVGWQQWAVHTLAISMNLASKIAAIENERKIAHQQYMNDLYDIDEKFVSDTQSLWDTYSSLILKTTLNTGESQLKAIDAQNRRQLTALRIHTRQVIDEIVRKGIEIGRAEEDIAKDIMKIEERAAEMEKALLSVKSAKQFEAVTDLIVEALEKVSKKLSEVARVAIDAWKIIGNNTKIKDPTTGKETPAVSNTAKFVAGLGAVSAITAMLWQSEKRTAVAVKSALSMAASGAAIGAAFSPLGAAIGAAAGALIGLVAGWNQAGQAARQANRDADHAIDVLQDKLLTTYGSLQNIRELGVVLGVDLAGAWGDTTVAGLEHFKKLVDEFDAKLQNLQKSLEKYGLTWKDMGQQMKDFFQKKFSNDLLDSFNLMVNAGVDVDKVIKGMSKDLNQYIIDSITAGVKIPAAMQPILKKMIELGLLTDEAARKMLGLSSATDNMPSLDEITAAAGRYGLQLDALGPKVAQLSINEKVKQIVADFNTLVAAGAPVNVILSSMTDGTKGMGEQVQELVNQAIKYGLELPASMKPILQAMIDAGILTDDTGKKLEDLSSLTFAADLSQMFETLIEKLDELIDKIGGVNDQVDNIPRDIEVRVNGKYYPPDIPEPPDPNNYAGGGVVYAAGGWVPRGSDTVPAMLTPGERVLSVAESRGYGRPIELVVISKLDGREVARNQVKYLPNQLALAGL